MFKEWYKAHKEEILQDFFTFLEFPSISADPAHHKDVRRTCEWLSAYLKKWGLDVEIWETPGQPVIFASRLEAGPDAPTVLIYHHYDVQPVDPLELWKTPPFEPTIRGSNVYARGAADNKGQCFYSVCALRAFLELYPKSKVNIKVFIEGEEESGGAGTSAIIEERMDQLKADHMLLVDCDMAGAGIPSVTMGLRGLAALEVECSNSAIDLHSGIHGGIALNPNRALATALASLWDGEGRVAIPGFYDRVRPFKPEEKSRIDMSFDLPGYQKSFGVSAFAAEKGLSLKESNWIRPTLEINGMWGGYTGSGFKTVIPAKAYAKISCRIVPDQEPHEISKMIADHLKKHVPEGIEIKVKFHHGAPAYRSHFDSPIVKIAASAYEEVFGKRCCFCFCGASIPIVVELAAASGAEVAMIGVGLPEDEIHAPNEHFGLDRFEQGFLAIGGILHRLSQTTPWKGTHNGSDR